MNIFELIMCVGILLLLGFSFWKVEKEARDD